MKAKIRSRTPSFFLVPAAAIVLGIYSTMAQAQESSFSSSEGSSQSPATAAAATNHFVFKEWYVRLIYAHGIMASLAWVVMIPLGAILFRVLKGRKSFWVHAILQSVSVLTFITAAGIGIWMAISFEKLSSPHAIIGLLVFSLAIIQPCLGITHHLLYSRQGHQNASIPIISTESSFSCPEESPNSSCIEPKSQSAANTTTITSKHSIPTVNPSRFRFIRFIRFTTIPGVFHRWIGRTTLTLAMINGGLGILLQNRANDAERIAYGVVAACIWLGYIFVVVMTDTMRKRRRESNQSQQSQEEQGQQVPEEDQLEQHEKKKQQQQQQELEQKQKEFQDQDQLRLPKRSRSMNQSGGGGGGGGGGGVRITRTASVTHEKPRQVSDGSTASHGSEAGILSSKQRQAAQAAAAAIHAHAY